MYRLVITPYEKVKFNISCSNEYFLVCAEDVCKVLEAFKSKKFFYSITEAFISNSDDVINDVLCLCDDE